MRLMLFIAFSFFILPCYASADEADYSYLRKYRVANESVTSFLKKGDMSFEELNFEEVFHAVNRTITAFGKLELEKLLEPISDVHQLNERRSIINFFLENEEEFDSLEKSLIEFKHQHESDVLHFLNPNLRFYFHEDPSIISSGKVSSLYQLGLQGFTTLLISQGIAYEGFQAYQNYGVVRNAANRGWFRGFVGYNLLGQVGGMAFAFYVTSQNALSTIQKISAADHKVLRFAKAHAHLEKILPLARNNPVLREQLARLEHSPSHNFTKLLASLNQRLAAEGSLIGQFSALFSLDLYDDLHGAAAQIARDLQLIGVIDAYLSVARLYKEYTSKGLPVTLATFNTQAKSGFKFVGLQNLIIESAISNDVDVGGSNSSQHIVLTGPHGCGKTTFMKSIAHAILLGQSILLVPAQSAHFVLVTDIHTYFNIGDNIVLGLSSFMAEHKRMADLRAKSERVSEDSNVLMLIDEPYAKTIQAVGEPRVTSFLKSVVSSRNLSVILATHFEEPSSLENTTGGIVKNLQPQIDAAMNPTYKIIPGAAEWWFNDKTQRELFIQRLIDERC